MKKTDFRKLILDALFGMLKRDGFCVAVLGYKAAKGCSPGN